MAGGGRGHRTGHSPRLRRRRRGRRRGRPDDESLVGVADEIRAQDAGPSPPPRTSPGVGEIPALFDRLDAEQLGGLDILVNSAGVQITGPSLEVTEEQWDETLDANLKSMFFSCQAAGRRFIDQGHGKIINLASTFSFVGFPEFAAYCSSKGGVALLTKTLAAEWAPIGGQRQCRSPRPQSAPR